MAINDEVISWKLQQQYKPKKKKTFQTQYTARTKHSKSIDTDLIREKNVMIKIRGSKHNGQMISKFSQSVFSLSLPLLLLTYLPSLHLCDFRSQSHKRGDFFSPKF